MTFRDQTDCYRAIAETLAAAAPAGWREIDAAISLDGARVDAVSLAKSLPANSHTSMGFRGSRRTSTTWHDW